MSSKLIDQFQSESLQVSAGAAAMAQEVGTTLAEEFAPYLEEGEKPVDWELAQKLISRMLAKKGQQLDHVDQALELDRAANKKLRGERDRLAAELRSELRSARLLLDESFDKNLSTGIFTRRQISVVRPVALARLARETAASLRSPEVAPTRSLAGGAFPEPAGVAEALDRRAQELENTLALLARKRETFGVGVKNQTLQEAAGGRRRAQDLLYGIYRGAGYDHLAARLRPKRRATAAASGDMGKKEGGAVSAQPAASVAEG